MYLLAPFILQMLNFKKILQADYEAVPFSGPTWPFCPEQSFSGTNHYYYFHLPIGTFHRAKFLKILRTGPELWGCTIFGPKMVHLPQTNFCLGKLLISFSSNYYPLSLCKIKKNFFQWILSYEDVRFLGPFPQMRIFSENLLMSLLSLHQSQILIY